MRAIAFVKEFNDLSRDDLNVSLSLSLNGLEISFHEATFLLARIKINDNYDLENFINFCQRVRLKGE